ncbi:unnamed protein product [Phytophthora lilii]|uniref:Unnamed protein product n=1 Tax=Phytophthora lilii TaxID=2077276 RepID=A0A9W7CS53_9STRA|nr:unnamed protein product [Phytophthora lilii]
MFSNFTSLAQREQKRQELIDRAQRRVRQAKAQREMYEGASWATDISNGITTVAKKATESTQTDSTSEPSEALKKTLIDEYSQTNPEVSTTPEVNVKPMMVDTGVEASLHQSHWIKVGLVIDVGISNTPIMNDAMVGEDAHDNIEKNVYSDDDDNAEIDEQKQSKLAVAEIYEVYPILADLHIHPLASNARQLTKYYIGKDAKTYSIRLNKLVLVPSINWSETYDHVRVVITNDVRFLNYIGNATK